MTRTVPTTGVLAHRGPTLVPARHGSGSLPDADGSAPCHSSQVTAPAVPRLVRRSSDRLLGGVTTGLADHLGLPVLWIRVALVVLTVTGGSGVALYAVLWLVLPLEQPGMTPPVRVSEQLWGQLAVLVAIGGGVLLLLRGLGFSPGGQGLVPLVVAGAGAAVVWRQADESRRARWVAARRRGGLLPLLLGSVLVAGGGIGFLATQGDLVTAREGLLSTLVVVGGLVVLIAPWALRTLSDLRAERLERIRSQERAELAAQVHDSVLQTLALIQRAAADPREVSRLARSGERELRSWLYRAPADPQATFKAALEAAVAEVEEAHGVPVEVVVVGDAPHVPPLDSLVAAAREAVVNASRHAGAPVVQVYAEVEPGRATVFVRDRGRGFDPDMVPADRYGVSGSVLARVRRVGGTASVRSAPGEGTEVRLEVGDG